jgi:serine/threonine protein kinase
VVSSSKPAPLPADTFIGNYRIVRRLATGGFGVVYLAEDRAGQAVAVKEFLPNDIVERSPGELAPRVLPGRNRVYELGLRSFFEEGRALAALDHPGVVRVLDFLEEHGTVYMVMNYLVGYTLQEFIVAARDSGEGAMLSEATIRSVFDDLLLGLRVVHQARMLHLDIKPANILITGDNRPVLLDFGAARKVLSAEGDFSRPMYTPGFAAPDMYRREADLGPWTDIYAVGACIYACMLGFPPYDAPTRRERDRLALSLTTVSRRYSENLIDVVQWCMSLNPLDRPQSVFTLQQALEKEPGQGGPQAPSWLQRWKQRLTQSPSS